MNARWKIRWCAGHGARIPRGWRMAWYEPRRRVGVYFPAPLHWLLRGLREIFYRVRMAWRAPGIERAQVFEMQRAHQARQRLADEYARGYMPDGANATRRASKACARSWPRATTSGTSGGCSPGRRTTRRATEREGAGAAARAARIAIRARPMVLRTLLLRCHSEERSDEEPAVGCGNRAYAKGKSRSLTAIRKVRGWVRDDKIFLCEAGAGARGREGRGAEGGVKAAEIFDVCFARYRGLREWLADASGAARAVRLEAPSGGYQWRPDRARACEFVADFERLGRRALRRPEWKGRRKLFEAYFLGGANYREAIRAVGVAEGTFDYWFREVKRAAGREFARAALYPPAHYFAPRHAARAGAVAPAASSSRTASGPPAATPSPLTPATESGGTSERSSA